MNHKKSILLIIIALLVVVGLTVVYFTNTTPHPVMVGATTEMLN